MISLHQDLALLKVMASDTDNGTHFYFEISILEKWVTDMQFFLSSDLNSLSGMLNGFYWLYSSQR